MSERRSRRMADAPYTREDHEAYRREVEAREEREARERRAATKEAAKKAWIKDGGTPSSFEAVWDDLEADGRKERLRKAGEAARQAQRGTSRI